MFIKNPIGLHFFIVESGSMQPTISPGSVVFTTRSNSLKVGNIITFSKPIGKTLYVTHRIVEMQNLMIKTKGDANNAMDDGYILSSQVLGKVFISLPYLGFFLTFMHTLPGLILFILLPSIIIIFREMLNIKRELDKKYNVVINLNTQTNFNEKKVEETIISILILLLLGLVIRRIPLTNSFYSQQKVLFTTNIATSTKIPITPTITPTPTQVENQFTTSFNSSRHELTVKIDNLSPGTTNISYTITYQTVSKTQGIVGSSITDPTATAWVKTFVLGTCSTGGVCVWDEGLEEVNIQIAITSNGESLILSKNVPL